MTLCLEFNDFAISRGIFLLFYSFRCFAPRFFNLLNAAFQPQDGRARHVSVYAHPSYHLQKKRACLFFEIATESSSRPRAREHSRRKKLHIFTRATTRASNTCAYALCGWPRAEFQARVLWLKRTRQHIDIVVCMGHTCLRLKRTPREVERATQSKQKKYGWVTHQEVGRWLTSSTRNLIFIQLIFFILFFVFWLSKCDVGLSKLFLL